METTLVSLSLSDKDHVRYLLWKHDCAEVKLEEHLAYLVWWCVLGLPMRWKEKWGTCVPSPGLPLFPAPCYLGQLCSSAAAAMCGRSCVHNQWGWLSHSLHAVCLYWSSWCNSVLLNCYVLSNKREWGPVFLKWPLSKHKKRAPQKGGKPWEPHQVVLFRLGLS